MVNEALDAQEQEFSLYRGADSDEQLLVYLCFCASILGHTPWSREIVGGSLIVQRFGSWGNALMKANLPKPAAPDKLTSFTRYQEEVERQKILYRKKKAAKKQLAQQRRLVQAKRKSA